MKHNYEPDAPERLCEDCKFYMEKDDLCWIPNEDGKRQSPSDVRADPLSCGPDAVNFESKWE